MTNNTDPKEYIGTKIEGYTLIQLLGRGSFATVYRAMKDGNETQFAVKVIPIGLVKYYDCEDSFWNEMNIMLDIKHPNITHCENMFQTNKDYYVVMKIANNGDLTQYMIKNGYMFFKELTALHFFKQIACGFMELRKNQVIHRDFKLEN